MSRPEQLVRVFADTTGRGRCRSCDASLTWYQTIAGKRMPFDGEPVPRASEHDADRRLVLLVSADDVHWVRCPEAARFRRRS